MQSVEFTLTVDHRGWGRIQVQPPYGIFGDFLSSVVTPYRVQALRETLAAYRTDPTRYADYSDDSRDLWLEPADGIARVVIDYPGGPREGEMPILEFVQLAEQWLAFAEVHPATLPHNPPSAHYPTED